MPKKIERGDPLVSSGFVGYVKKVKNERGTLCTKFALAGLGLSNLSSFISFCKKWYIRDEVCGLTKKKEIEKTSHCKSRALFTRKAPTKNISLIFPETPFFVESERNSFHFLRKKFFGKFFKS